MTVQELISGALMDMGVLGQGQTAGGAQANFALSVLNDSLIESWSTDRLLIYTISRVTWTMANGQASYTVGSGGEVNIARPSTMNMQGCNVSFIDTTASTPYTELPLWPLTDTAFQAIPQKTYGATYPTGWYYNPTFTSAAAPYGTLSFYPVPNVSTLIGVLYAPVAAGTVALSDTLAIPPGYKRFYRTNLAAEMLDAFSVPAETAARIERKARESKGDIERVNTRIQDLGVDLALRPVPPPSNIYTDV